MNNERKKILHIILAIIALAAGLLLALAAVALIIMNLPARQQAENASAIWSDGTSAVQPDSVLTEQRTGMYVDGTSLRFADGEQFVMRGVNHAHCWYTAEDETALDAIAATGANAVRIVCANGIQWESDTGESIHYMIDETVGRGMVAIVEIHDGTGSDNPEVLEQIVDFWCDNAGIFEGTQDYCILNIANEWCGSWNSKLWRDGYVSVITRLREAGIDNVIMVDAPGWGQYGRGIDRFGLEVFNSDPQHNTMFSVHMYGLSGRTRQTIRYNLEAATKQNLCVCVGEFGYTHSDGDVKEDFLMEYCEANDIGYLGWSWKGNSGGVEYLDIAQEWDGTALTPEWGEKLINGEFGIRNTSKQRKK